MDHSQLSEEQARVLLDWKQAQAFTSKCRFRVFDYIKSTCPELGQDLEAAIKRERELESKVMEFKK